MRSSTAPTSLGFYAQADGFRRRQSQLSVEELLEGVAANLQSLAAKTAKSPPGGRPGRETSADQYSPLITK